MKNKILWGLTIILPKAKPNSVAGVRTVWAMHNDKTWAESNRFGE